MSNHLAFRAAGSVVSSSYNKLADFEAQVMGLYTKLVHDITHTLPGTADRTAATKNFETFLKNAPQAVIPKLPIEPLQALVGQEAGFLCYAQDFARAGMRAEKLLPLFDVCQRDDADTALALIRILYEKGTPPAVLLPSLKTIAEKFSDNTQGALNTADITHNVVEVATAMTYGQTVDPAVYGFLKELNADPHYAYHSYKVQPALQRLDQSMQQYIHALNDTMQASYDLGHNSRPALDNHRRADGNFPALS